MLNTACCTQTRRLMVLSARAHTTHSSVFVAKRTLLMCVVLEPFPDKRRTTNRPHIGNSLTLKCTPPYSFPHPNIFWAIVTSANRLEPVDYTNRVTIDPIGTVPDFPL